MSPDGRRRPHSINMDFTYSPHRESGGMLHFPSPNHHHYRIDNLHSMKHLRRSLAHSPSKPSRFSLIARSPSGSPESPTSPLVFARTCAVRAGGDSESVRSRSASPSVSHSPAALSKKTKFFFRRSAPLRAAARSRTSKVPLRQPLGDSPNSANMGANPFESPAKPSPTTTGSGSNALKRLRPMDPPPPFEFVPSPAPFVPETPFADFRPAPQHTIPKPAPAAFMSTGLISKRNRPVEHPLGDSTASYEMPETPSKRASFPPATNRPFPRSSLSRSIRHLDDSGSGALFSPSPDKLAGDAGKGMGIFGVPFQKPAIPRRESFASIDGDDWPGHGLHVDSQSSNDELPPTPTKPNGGSMRSSNVKEHSLRSSLLGRRSSIGIDTFVPPSEEGDQSPQGGKMTSESVHGGVERRSPHTPQEAFMPPDPSGLSISGRAARRKSMPLHSSSNTAAFPPATPTAQRDQGFIFGHGKPTVAPLVGLRPNDVDTALTSRFDSVALYGNGEFSRVYRVEKPVQTALSSLAALSKASVWAVKKNKRPYNGYRDRERKLQEVEILKRLRNHDNVIQLTDSWETDQYLYIQTEFCENGNLRDFLTTAGYKARLDDFRIWKILLEISSGIKSIHESGFIHLDLKPANVFIDWEGVLKIGDFGLASPWPAPAGIDGEGDREYIGPEILSGSFDKPADIFALGMVMLEIAGNIVLPDNGASWQRLRSGNFTDVPSLTWTSDTTLARDASGEPLIDGTASPASSALHSSPGDRPEIFQYQRNVPIQVRRPQELASPPNFMVDADDSEALDRLVQWMIAPVPGKRPVVDQIYFSRSLQWVEKRRRAGATIYEGNWGPADEVLHPACDVDMMDAN